jgi:hypothetical protein
VDICLWCATESVCACVYFTCVCVCVAAGAGAAAPTSAPPPVAPAAHDPSPDFPLAVNPEPRPLYTLPLYQGNAFRCSAAAVVKAAAWRGGPAAGGIALDAAGAVTDAGTGAALGDLPKGADAVVILVCCLRCVLLLAADSRVPPTSCHLLLPPFVAAAADSSPRCMCCLCSCYNQCSCSLLLLNPTCV